MESLEIAHKLLQLITRTLIQMITLNRKLWNPLLSLSFLFFSCLCARMCVSLCVKMHCCFVHFARVCQWRGGVLWKGQRSVTPWRTDRAKAASPTLPPVPPPSPWAVMGCLRGWRFPGNWLLSALRGWCRAACWRWRGRGAQSDIGWNSHMSYMNKVNNFQPLLTTCLCFFSRPSC